MNTLTDQSFVEKTLAGDTQAYAFLVNRHKDLVYTVALRMMKNREEAEEIAQDTFVKAYQRLASFKGEAKFSTWLYRIAYHASLDALKRNKRMLATEDVEMYGDDMSESSPDVIQQLSDEERRQKIRQAIGQLMPKDAAVITLFYLEEHSIKEVAVALDMSDSQVKVRLHRSRKKLMNLLSQSLAQYF